MIVIDELGPFPQQLHQTSTPRGSIIQHKQGIQLYYGGCYDTKFTIYNLQFQYFNKCLLAIFAQLSWKYLAIYFGWGLFWLQIIKIYYKSPLKVCELKVWVK